MKKSRKTEQEWKKLLADCKARPKGVRIPVWCDQQGISLETYKYWQRKLRSKYKAAPADPDIQFVPLSMPVKHEGAVPLSSSISIHYKEFEIVVTEQSLQKLLTRLLAVVRTSC